MSSFHIAPVRTAEDLRSAAELIATYAASLPIELGYQDFEPELAGLPGKYAPPEGELLLARGAGGEPLGCVGVRPIAPDGCCEMKRLYVRPEARGLGLGRPLADAAIETAKRLGYRRMLLDTLPSMAVAIGLYERLGFARIAPYYGPTPDGTVFMGLSL